jgi:uncharacterized protein (DUF1015 family)
MSATYKEWKQSEVLTQERVPAYYFIKDEFLANGTPATRFGFVGLLELQEFGKGKVFPHEFTLAGPKKDRLALLEEMGAESSQIFFCYRDPQLTIESIFKSLSAETPRYQGIDSSGVKRSLWTISDPATIQSIESALSDCDFLIADGHHRYETALEYRRLHPGESSRFVQAYFTNSLSPGFAILPIHRLFRLPTGVTTESLIEDLKKRGYEIESANERSLSSLTTTTPNSLSFGFSDQGGTRKWKISIKKSKNTDTAIARVQKDLFEAICRWTPEELKKGIVTYENTDEKFLEVLQSDSQKVGVYLPACTYDEIMNVVKSGDRMPQKSTFFAPKLASGLVIYDLQSH